MANRGSDGASPSLATAVKRLIVSDSERKLIAAFGCKFAAILLQQ